MSLFWDIAIEHGRIAQWLITIGGIALCICGGILGFLDAGVISSIFLAVVAGVFGIENIQKAG